MQLNGIFIIADVGGEAGKQIKAINERFDPRLARYKSPHITITGSSGVGPIPASVTTVDLWEALSPIALDTAPMTLELQPPHRFMQTEIVVLPLDPHGPLRTLHERIKTAGFRAARPRFYFTPHVTLNLYRELPANLLASLLAERFDEAVTIDSLEAHLTRDTGESRELVRVGLGG